MRSEPVALLGMACRTPGGVTTPEALWNLLASGTDAISEIPPERWSRDAYYDADPNTPGRINTRFGGFLQDIDRFDPGAFGISPKEARHMDPQQRLLLQTAWEAFDDGGAPLETIRGARAGVFFGMSNSDYGRMQLQQPADISAYTLSGTAPSIAAGRLSYLFDLRGPSVVIDTACSSSLVAIHLAVQSLRSGDCDIAAAGGVSLNIKPEQTISLAKWGMLAPDGRCKTFDARANGFVRSEGCGVVVLMRLADAVRDGLRIQAVIRGSAVNQDGRSNVLTAPNGEAQRKVLHAALQQAGISAHDVSFVETHGTGTKVGDPIEVEALVDVYSASRPRENVCHLGAVKANLGHLEAAAGVAALIKAVLCIRHGAIPPQVHFRSLNPLLSLDGTAMSIPVKLTPWESNGKPRVAGVSSFGFSGTNAHVLIEEPPALPVAQLSPEQAVFVLPVSAKAAPGVARLAAGYTERIPEGAPGEVVRDVCFTAARHRAHMPFRRAVAGDGRTLRRVLREWSTMPAPAMATDEPKIGFVYSGQGCNWFGMARSLLAEDGVFTQSIDACGAIVRELAGWSIRAELEAPAEQSRLDSTECFQPVLFAIQAALTKQLEHWGIRPFAVAGHSVGEIAAAHAAGILSLEDALRLVQIRGRLMQQASGRGAMAAVALPGDAAARRVDKGFDLSIAAANGPDASTVSGTPAAVRKLVAELTAEGVFCRELGVDCAFHSSQMDPYIAPLLAGISGIVHRESRSRFVSTVTGTLAGGVGAVLDAGYWGRNVREPVLFDAAVAEMMRAGCTAFIEIGPHPVLSGYVLDIIAAAGRDCPVFPTMRRDQDDRTVAREAVAGLYAHGCDPDWAALAPRGRIVSLPSYPWQQDSYWIAEAPNRGKSSSRGDRIHSLPVHPLLGWRVESPFGMDRVFENVLASTDPSYIGDHRVGGSCLVPATAMIEMMLNAVRTPGRSRYGFRNFSIDEPLALPDDAEVVVQTGVVTTGESETIRLYSRDPASSRGWLLHASCELVDEANVADVTVAAEDGARKNSDTAVSVNAYYDSARTSGLEFGPAFQSLGEANVGAGRARGRICLHESASHSLDDYLVHPVLMDGALQLVDVALRSEQAGSAHALLLPIGIERLTVYRPLRADALASVELEAHTERASIVRANVDIFSLSGEKCVSLRGAQFKQTDINVLRKLVRKRAQEQADSWMYRLQWHETASQAMSAMRGDQPGALMVVATDVTVAKAIGTRAGASGRYGATAVLIDSENGGSAEGAFRDVDLADAAAVQKAVEAAVAALRRDLPGTQSIDVVLCGGTVDATLDHQPESARKCTAEPERGSGAVGALHVLQALIASATDARVFIVTHGAQATGEHDDCDPEQAALWGLASTFLVEHAEISCVMIDLDPELEWHRQADALLHELAASPGNGERIAFRDQRRYVCRLEAAGEPVAAENTGSLTRIEKPVNGLLDDLLFAQHERRAPGPGEVEIETRTLGVNFRDVLNALGEVEGPAGPALGAECVGTITATGDGVREFEVGDRVMAFAPGGMATHVVAPASQVAKLPEGLGTAEAATCPVAFLTAKYALERVAGLRDGEVVLIHAAAGGVGLAAVQLAMQAGARIIATAGSDAKRDYLRGLGVEDVFDSRSLAFAEDVRRVTAGKGVDVVLNSLAGEFIPASLSLLQSGGRFVELGKRDDWDADKVSKTCPGVFHTRFDLGTVAAKRPDVVREMFDELAADLEAGGLRPLPYRVYPFRNAARAFRRMAQGRHTGKLVLSRVPRPGPAVRSDASYLVTGGLGALGLAVAERLAVLGAGHLVLTARSNGTEDAQERVQAIRTAGTPVTVRQVDVADLGALKAIFEEIDETLPLKGIVHCAGVLADAAFGHQTVAGLREVMAPKIAGTWNLHALSRTRELDYFVLFSSAAALLGWPGQANYGAANAAMDAIAFRRRASGLPAVTINWGAWGVAGMVQNVRDAVGDPFSRHGLLPHTPEEGVDAFVRVVESGANGLLIGHFDWERFAARYPASALPAFFDRLCGHQPVEPAAPGRDDAPALIDELTAALPAQRRRAMEQFLTAQAASALGLPGSSAVSRKVPLNEQGLDSLLAVEMRNAIAKSIGRSLPASLLFDHPSINALAHHLLENVLQLGDKAPRGSTTDNVASLQEKQALESDIGGLSDEEAEAMLSRELEELALDRKSGGLAE